MRGSIGEEELNVVSNLILCVWCTGMAGGGGYGLQAGDPSEQLSYIRQPYRYAYFPQQLEESREVRQRNFRIKRLYLKKGLP